MHRHDGHDERVRRYLLGDLDEGARLRLEEQLLTDEDFYEELLASEEELVDEYLAGALSEADRARFEQIFLSTDERRRKLDFARAFRRYAAANAAHSEATAATTARSRPKSAGAAAGAAVRAHGPSSWGRLFTRSSPAFGLAAAALLLAALVGSVLLYRSLRTGPSAAAEREFAQLNDPRQQDTHVEGFLPLDLSPGLTRGEGQTNRAHLRAGSPGLRLRLDLPPGAPETFRARLRAIEDDALFYTVDDLRAVGGEGARAVLLYVPAALLPPGDHQIKLSGRNLEGDFEDVGTYNFRVTRD